MSTKQNSKVATKKNAAAATNGTRPKTLSREAALAAAAAAEAEEKRLARNAYTRAWRKKQRELTAAVNARGAQAAAQQAAAATVTLQGVTVPAAVAARPLAAAEPTEALVSSEQAAALNMLRSTITAARFRAEQAAQGSADRLRLEGIASGLETALTLLTVSVSARRSA